MVVGRTGGGLCATCAHLENCHLACHRSGNVLHCDEYQPGAECASLPPGSPPPHDVATGDRAAGLCADCTHRSRCALSLTEGGVWYCEEYES
jgi:hypothetical protein